MMMIMTIMMKDIKDHHDDDDNNDVDRYLRWYITMIYHTFISNITICSTIKNLIHGTRMT